MGTGSHIVVRENRVLFIQRRLIACLLLKLVSIKALILFSPSEEADLGIWQSALEKAWVLLPVGNYFIRVN
jgi:hypothetical protein